MVNRLGANQNNPFETAGRPAVRNLHLKSPESFAERVENLKNGTKRKQGKFGELVKGEIVDAQVLDTRSRRRKQDRQFDQEAHFASAQDIARKMHFERARAAAEPQDPELRQTVTRQEFEQLKSEMKQMRSDLKTLMAGKKISSKDQVKQAFAKPSSINIGFGTGFEIAEA